MTILAALTEAVAQEGLNVETYFSQEFMSRPGVSGLNVSNKALDKAGISVYRSISVSDNPETVSDLEKAVKRDGAKAVNREVSYRDGKLHFGWYVMAPLNGNNRFLIYLNRTEAESNRATVIYIEGKGDTAKIKQFLNKKVN